MSSLNLTGTPYYDRYNANKNYAKVLFQPGMVQQSREVNEVQSMQLDFLKRLGDAILKDGSIVEGCSLIIKDGYVTVSKGKVYLQGIVRDVEEASVPITGKGNEVIGVKVTQTVITEVEDAGLLDPAQGYDNYNQAGAHRLKETVTVTVNDAMASALYNVENGDILSYSEEKPQDNKWVDMMARRTFDESGNYKVKGLEMFDKGMSDDNGVYISLEGGRAYVCGYEVNKATSSTIQLEKSKSFRKVTSEPKIFTNGVSRYRLNNEPVKDISRVVAIVEVTQNITRGNLSGGLDYLPKRPVVSIVKVENKTLGTTYQQGVDFRLSNDGIDWSLTGIEPAVGSSYSVTWTYNKVLDPQNDYKLSVDGSEDNVECYIEFTDTGDKPVAGTSFNIDYEFYLSRMDLICLDCEGRIKVIQGQPDIERLIFTPSNRNNELFPLGAVTLRANSSKPVIHNQSVSSLSMEKLYAIISRLEDVEYNQAFTDLDNEAMEGEQASQLKGIFTDGFIGFSKCDLSHSDFKCAFDLFSRELTLSSGFHQYIPVIKNTAQLGTGKRTVTARYDEIVGIAQEVATGSMKVNAYAAFDEKPIISLEPAVDNWIDNSNMTIYGSAVTIEATTTIGSSYTTSRDVVTSKIMDSTITYMRQIPVKVEAVKFPPLTDLIRARFDGVPVDLSPVNESYKGSITGTVKSDSGGAVKASFTIPPLIRTGTRELILASDNLPNLIASTQFTANGINRTTQTTVYTEITNVTRIDPLAQSFSFDTNRIITSIGLYFSGKDTSPVTVQVRNMVNGFPGNTVYAEKVIPNSDIIISSNSTAETKVTFDDPVFCRAGEQYCFSVMTESTVTSVYIAALGDKNIQTNTQVTKLAYSVGLMFSSCNAITWTAHQSQDMKFKIYTAKFDTSSLIEFNDVALPSVNKIMLTADYTTPTGTNMLWEYKVNNDEHWLPISEFLERELSQVATKVSLRTSISSLETVAPALALDTLSIISYDTHKTGAYVSKNVVMPQPFTKVKQVMDIALPVGTSVVVKFATDRDGNTWTTAPNTGVTPVDQDFSRYTFEYTLPEGKTDFRCKLELSTNEQCVRPRVKNLMNILK